MARLAREEVVLLTYACTEQMAQLRDVEMSMDATPTAEFVMIQAEFFLSLAKAAFDRPDILPPKARAFI